MPIAGAGNRRLLIPASIVDDMYAHAKRERPRECCGLLSGSGGMVRTVYPLINESDGVDEYLAAAGLIGPFRQMRADKEDLLAIYHSHPDTEPVPSNKDLKRNHYPETVHLIISLAGPQPRMRAYLLGKDDYVPVDWDSMGRDDAGRG